MRHRSVQSRAGSLTAAAVLAVGFGVSAAQAGFVLDLKLTTGGGTATTVSPGSVVSLDVYGTVTGGATTAKIQGAFFGVTNSAAAGNLSTVVLASQFTGVATDVAGVTTSTGGTLYGPTGGKSVGSTDNSVADGWVFARSTTMYPVTSGSQVLLGQLTFTAGASAGATTLTINPRGAGNLVVPALWMENSTVMDGPASVGSSVTITVANTIILGDLDGSGHVDTGDVQLFRFAINNPDNEPAAFNAQFKGTFPNANYLAGDFDGDGAVTTGDVQGFRSALNNAGEPGGLAFGALTAVPEPASFGLISVGLLGLARRRRA